MTKLLTLPALTLLGLAFAAGAPPAESAVMNTLAAGACKSALPVYDGLIRTRPLAVQNEGTSSAFVSCAQPADPFGTRPRYILIYLINQGSTARTLSCTLVVGSTSPSYSTKSLTVLPGMAREMEFASGGVLYSSGLHAFSCNLPPGTGIREVGSIGG